MIDTTPINGVRQIILDTETTGLEVERGHRIIEIACVELMHRRVTGETFHHFLNPERDIDEAAQKVHGHGIVRDELANQPRSIAQDKSLYRRLTRAELADQPLFATVADDLLRFIDGAEVIIHNADFDIGFINAELSLAGHQVTDIRDCCAVLDSLALARKLHFGQRNDLGALCERYEIDDSERTLHGALLDARLLAEVYLAMTGGQPTLVLNPPAFRTPKSPSGDDSNARPSVDIIRADPEELRAHEAFLDKIQRESDEGCVWRRRETTA